MSRGFNKGIQPDGDYVDPKADGQSTLTTTALGATILNGAINDSATTITVDDTSSFASSGQINIEKEIIEYTGKTATTFTGCTRGTQNTTAAAHDDNSRVSEVYTSAWTDADGWATIEVFVRTDVPSNPQGIVIEYTDDANVGTPAVRASKYFEFNSVDVARGYKDIRVTTLLDGYRVKYINNSEAQGSFFMETTLRVQPENGLFNEGNSQVTAQFLREVALGNVSNYRTDVKFGRNPDVDTGGAEDIWNGGGSYAGFNATADENISTVSSSANDVGGLRSSGTVTTASKTQLIDSSATFVTDSVAVGDIVLNDSQGIHGIVTSVDSETTLTVFNMIDSTNGEYMNIVGDSYRVAYSNGTGAAVVEWSLILDSEYRTQVPVFVILNGTTPVSTTGNFFRLSRGKVLLAGSLGHNAGTLTVNQAVTTANVFAVMPATFNQTSIAAGTVPADEIFLVESLKANLFVSTGTTKAGTIAFKVRPKGQVFNVQRVYSLTSGGGSLNDTLEGGLVLNSGTDYKFTAESVTDNNTVITAQIEFLEIDRQNQ